MCKIYTEKDSVQQLYVSIKCTLLATAFGKYFTLPNTIKPVLNS